jgi:hypothetical protein
VEGISPKVMTSYSISGELKTQLPDQRISGGSGLIFVIMKSLLCDPDRATVLVDLIDGQSPRSGSTKLGDMLRSVRQ